MGVFGEAERRYLAGGRQLGRIATVGADGTPHVGPVAWIYNAARDTIDVGGSELERSKKFRDVVPDGASRDRDRRSGKYRPVASAQDRHPRAWRGDRATDTADPHPSRADRQLGARTGTQRAHVAG
jgi:pyridoxamine 5'-phosphate oxidase-like protein